MGISPADHDRLCVDRIVADAREHATDRRPSIRRASVTASRQHSTAGVSIHSTKSNQPSKSDNADGLDGNSEKPSPGYDAATADQTGTDPASVLPPPAPPPAATQQVNTQVPCKNDSALERNSEKPPWSERAAAGCKRFLTHTKNALMHSWINVLLVFVPVGIAVNWVPIPGVAKPTVVFAMNAVAIVPLAGLLAHATESVASRMGDTWASLLNVTFGNAVELIIFIIALAKNQIRIVQASILGSILANLLLILGMAFLFGGLRFREQIYNSTVTQMSACLLSLSVTSLLLPTAFHASFNDTAAADHATIKISRGTSVVLLLVYVLYLAFQLKSHAYMYESTPQKVIDEESHPGVLAELMNSSSDDSSSSSGDSNSDSDSSLGSHKTAKKRFKRALRKRRKRRKSSSSSTVTASVPSTISSPMTENRSVFEDNITAAWEHEHGETNQQIQWSEPADGLHSSDEADYGEKEKSHSDMMPRVRDFEAERLGGSTTSFSKVFRSKHKRRKNKKGKQPQNPDVENGEKASHGLPIHDTSSAVRPKAVDFTPEPQIVGSETAAPPPKRPFSKRQLSRPSFRGPLPSLLSNTVFSTPPPPTIQPSLASWTPRGSRVGIRRTNSLPDLVRGPGGITYRRESGINVPRAADYHRGGAMPMNEADVIAADEAEDDTPPQMSRTAAVVLLLCTTALVAFCAELLVDAIPGMVSDTSVSEAFIGLIILPIVGNAAEHVTAVTVAVKNKMDLAIGVAVGSSIQIALFVTPFVVVLGWIMSKDMSLYFNLFETVSLFVTTLIVNFLILDGRSNYLEGSLLIAAYVIIAVSSFFYPSSQDQSELGGSEAAIVTVARMLLRT